MDWRSIGRVQRRYVTAIYTTAQRGYVASLVADGQGYCRVGWVDVIVGDEARGDLPHRLVGRLLAQQHQGEELVLCLGADSIETLEKAYPPLPTAELKAAVQMEVEFSYGTDCLWGYTCNDSRVSISVLPRNQLQAVMEPYKEAGPLAAIMGLAETTDKPAAPVSWGEFSPEGLDDRLVQLVNTLCSYVANGGICFFRRPAALYKWRWARIGMAFLLVNVILTACLGMMGFWWHRDLKNQLNEYRHQALLTGEVAVIRDETGEMAQEIKRRAAALAAVRHRGMSGYGFMVQLASVPYGGVTLTEAETVAGTGVVLRGRAENMECLLEFTRRAGCLGGWLKQGLTIENSRQDENGDIQFVCRGQL